MVSIIPKKQIRQSSDIVKIVIHHSLSQSDVTGEQLNKEFAVVNSLGLPYDIIINNNGKIDLSSQWLYALTYDQYKKDVSYRNVIPTVLHHYAECGKTEDEKKKMIHIVLTGNFDQESPTNFQLSSLKKIVEFLCKTLNLCIIEALVYYSEMYLISSPGVLFPEKERIIDEIMQVTSIKNLCE